jgi:DNA-binding CsgD family transcriptional regulator
MAAGYGAVVAIGAGRGGPRRSGSGVAAQVFVGRDAELDAMLACAAEAAGGRARVVWVEGEAGEGKTTLVRQVLGRLPDGFTVVRAEADELASDIPYAVAAQLGPVRATEAFRAGLELLDAFSRRQKKGPVAVLVEDLHWADLPSRQALLAAARRLGDDRVLLLVTSRLTPQAGDGWERFADDQDRCLRITLGALSAPEVASLALGLGVRLTRGDAERLHAHTGGHALHVTALLREVDRARLTSLDGGLPAPRSLASMTVARIAEEPAPARDLAAALAVLNQQVPLAVAARVAGISQPSAALDRLLATGLVTWRPSQAGTPTGFAHPLYQVAVYDDLSPTRRQALHRAAAGQTSGGAALAHRIAAADGTDDALAAEVEASARAELARGAKGAAAAWLLWASSLSTPGRDAERRLLEAADLLIADGQAARAAGLRDRAEACAPGLLRDLVLGQLAWTRGDIEAAERFGADLVAAADVADSGDQTAARALATVSMLNIGLGRPDDAVVLAEWALARDSRDPDTDANAWLALAYGEGFRRSARAGLDRLAPRLPQDAASIPEADTGLLVTRGVLEDAAGQTGAVIADLRVAVRRAHQGAGGRLARACVHLAHALSHAGEWDQAIVQAHVGLSLTAGETWGWLEARAEICLGMVRASRGEFTRAGEHLARAQALTAGFRPDEITVALAMGEASVARARGEPGQVAAVLAPLCDLIEGPTQYRMTALIWWVWLVAALTESGDVQAAQEQLTRLDQAASRLDLDLRARLTGLRARLAAARGDASAAQALFGEAASLLGGDDPLLDRALLHHAYGQFLLGHGDHQAALGQLTAAHGLLAGLGAAPYLRRIEADLAAAGAAPSAQSAPREADSVAALTERERDVVTLACTGLTNREIAAELYVSQKAVEYHLGNVFGKLGISSRRELRGVLSAAAAVAG